LYHRDAYADGVGLSHSTMICSFDVVINTVKLVGCEEMVDSFLLGWAINNNNGNFEKFFQIIQYI
jgi:hypothetical protein